METVYLSNLAVPASIFRPYSPFKRPSLCYTQPILPFRLPPTISPFEHLDWLLVELGGEAALI